MPDNRGSLIFGRIASPDKVPAWTIYKEGPWWLSPPPNPPVSYSLSFKLGPKQFNGNPPSGSYGSYQMYSFGRLDAPHPMYFGPTPQALWWEGLLTFDDARLRTLYPVFQGNAWLFD